MDANHIYGGIQETEDLQEDLVRNRLEARGLHPLGAPEPRTTMEA